MSEFRRYVTDVIADCALRFGGFAGFGVARSALPAPGVRKAHAGPSKRCCDVRERTGHTKPFLSEEAAADATALADRFEKTPPKTFRRSGDRRRDEAYRFSALNTRGRKALAGLPT